MTPATPNTPAFAAAPTPAPFQLRKLLPRILLLPFLLGPLAARAPAAHPLEALLSSEAEKQGDLARLAELWFQFLEEQPASPYAELCLLSLKNQAIDRVTPAASELRLKRLLENESRLIGPARQLARDLYADLLKRGGKTRELEAFQPDRGFLVRWAFIGPFGAGFRSQIERSYPPENGIDFSRQEDGLRRRLSWQLLKTRKPEREVDLEAALDGKKGMVYCLSQFQSAAGLDARLAVEAPEPVRVWLNDIPVLQESPEQYLETARLADIRLVQGWNRILVKTAASFSIQIQDRLGGPLSFEALKEETALVDHPPAADAAAPPAEKTPAAAPAAAPEQAGSRPRAASRLESLRGEDAWRSSGADGAKEKALLAMGFAALASYLDRPDLAVPAAEEALRENAGDASIQFQAGRILLEARHLPKEHARRRARHAFDTALKLDGAFVPARLELASFLKDDQDPRRALEEVQKALETSPQSIDALLLRQTILEGKNWQTEALQNASRIEEVAPYLPGPAIYRAEVFEQRLNRTAAIRNYRIAHEKDRRLAYLLGEIASMERARGNLAAAIEALEAWRVLEPNHTGVEQTLARYLSESGKPREAIELLQKSIAASNTDLGMLRQLGEAWEQAGDAAEALAAYRRILERAPGDVSLERYVAQLEGRTWDRYWTAFDEKLADWTSKEPDPESSQGADSLMMLDIGIIEVYPDGSTSEYTHQATRLLSEASKGSLSKVRIPGEIQLLRTVTPGGKTLEPVAAEGRGTFVMPGLEPGAIVELAYVVDRPNFSGWLFQNGPFYFQDTQFRQPFLLSRYVLILPPGMPLDLIERAVQKKTEALESAGDFAKVARTEKKLSDGRRAVSFETRNAPRLKPENRVPPRDDFIPNVRVIENRSWLEVADALGDSVSRRTRLTEELRQFAAESVRGIEAPLDRVKALYLKVNDAIKTDKGPSDALGVLMERGGDRESLLKALLEAAGIPVWWAFARPRDIFIGKADWQHPSTELFQQALLYCEPPGADPQWLYLDARQAPFGMMPAVFQGGQALVLRDGGPSVLSIPRTAVDETFDSMNAVISLGEVAADALAARVQLSIVARSYQDYGRKMQLQDLDEHRRSLALRQMGAAFFPGARVSQASFKDLDRAGSPFAIQIELEAPKFLQEKNRQVILRTSIQPLNLVRVFIRNPERRYPYHLNVSMARRDSLQFKLGKNFQVSRLTESNVRFFSAGSFSLRFRKEGPPGQETVWVDRELILEPAMLSPEDFQQFLRFCQAVDQAEAERIVLVKRSN